MKRKTAFCVILCVAGVVLLAAVGLWRCLEMKKDKQIISFVKITLDESGMRFRHEYEIVFSDGQAEVKYYTFSYSDGEEQRIPEKSAECGADEVLALLNDCRVFGWDGFVGKHPRGVLDGIMFTFNATVNGGETIYAHGSQNFPKKYREFRDGLYEMLNRQD